MEFGAITSRIDVAQVVLYFFWIFFAGLLFYLRREDRREGYPLISDAIGTAKDHGFIWIPAPKTFNLADGRKVTVPNGKADTRLVKASPAEPWSGAPLRPTGNPMADGVGPGAYALRADIADVTYEGHARIVPLRAAAGFMIEPRDPDPRGMMVVGADGQTAGQVVDAWVDRSECLLRYLEVAVGSSAGAAKTGKRVLLPMTFSVIDRQRNRVAVHALLANQFAAVPATKSPETVTLLEEERIVGYYGGGTLFATPSRQEPLL